MQSPRAFSQRSGSSNPSRLELQDTTQSVRSPGAAWTGDFMESFLPVILRAFEGMPAAWHVPKIRLLTDYLCTACGDGKR